MGLRIPCAQMKHIVAALWFWFIEIGIWLGKGTEQFSPAALEVQTKSGVKGMAGFMTKNSQTLSVSTALHLQHLLTLEFHEPGVGKIERDRDSRHTVRGEPLLRQPNVRLETDATPVELTVETLNVWFEKRPLYLYWQIAN